MLLGAVFVFHARLMLFPAAPAEANSRMLYIAAMPSSLRVFAGVAEGAAGLGIVFAGLFHIATVLVPLAGAGLAILMLGAIVFHMPRREYPNIAFNAVLLVLSTFVAYMRAMVAPL